MIDVYKRQVSFRLLCNITGNEIPNLSTLSEPVVVVAKDLTPSDTGSLNKEFAKGFATEDVYKRQVQHSLCMLLTI